MLHALQVGMSELWNGKMRMTIKECSMPTISRCFTNAEKLRLISRVPLFIYSFVMCALLSLLFVSRKTSPASFDLIENYTCAVDRDDSKFISCFARLHASVRSMA